MKKKVFWAFLLAGALAVTPIGSGFMSAIATASSNNTVAPSAPSNNTVAPSTGASENRSFERQAEVSSLIINAASGDTVEIEGVRSLSNAVMQDLLKKDNVKLVLKYTYEDVDYVVTIPSGMAMDDDIPWYGPLYLAALYGNGAEGTSYVVKSGDTLSRIALANAMTLADLIRMNPQIANPNLIRVGEQINIK